MGKNTPETTNLYLSNRIPLEPQKGTNGDQAALQYPEESQVGIHKYTQARNISHDLNNRHLLDKTPKITGVQLSPKKLFHEEMKTDKEEVLKIPTDTDLEILLINSCRIDATKVQTIVTNFVEDKEYTTIFCMTETKVDSHNFQPQGITIFSAHRRKKEKKGGGLTIGYATKADIHLKEIETKSNDILALEGTVLKSKFRIILCYFDSSKSLNDQDYKNNRALQKEVENLMEVDQETDLVCLGDMNGRLTKLEPDIKTDANGKMIERWTDLLNMHHLNYTEECVGTYTFESPNGHSTIDHVLVNNSLQGKYKGMYINEGRDMLNISDNNLVRTWFRINPEHNKPKWKKTTKKCISWISRDGDRLIKCAETFKKKIGKKHSFNKCMKKLKSSIDET